MKRFISPKTLTLIKVLMPSFVGISMLTLEKTMRNVSLQSGKLKSSILDPELESGSPWFFASICDVFKSLGNMIFESYDDYFAFTFMMLTVNVLFHGSGIFRHLFTKKNKASTVSHWKSSLFDKEFLMQGLRSLLKYSLIFCLYQTIWIGLVSNGLPFQALLETAKSPLNIAENIRREVILPSRILQQEETASLMATSISPFPDVNIRKKPSLSMGKVIGRIDIFAVSIQLSKDENTAFVTTSFPSTLKVYDVSDPEYPVILSTLNLPRKTSDYISKSILVSPDETKLFISNIEYLQVIDISSLKSPSSIALLHDSDFSRSSSTLRTNGLAKPNLILSRDNKFLFVSGYGLQIFDMTTQTAPVLIYSVRSRSSSEYSVPASIALSEDGKTLYYSDGGLSVYDVEDPKKMRLINSFNATYQITSMMLSNDAKTAFVLGQDKESQIILQAIDISDVSSIKEGQITVFDKVSSSQPIFLERAPDNIFMVIAFVEAARITWSSALIFDTQGGYLLENKRILIKYPLSVKFTEDYKRVFVGNSAGKLEIVDLTVDYPNKHAFAESRNVLETFDVDCAFFTLSKNEKMIYSIYRDPDNSPRNVFGIHQDFRNIASFEIREEIIQMVISQDNKMSFLLLKHKIVVINISNSEKITKLGEFTLIKEETTSERRLNFLTLSQDGKTGFLTVTDLGENYLVILDVSDPQNIRQTGSPVRLGKMAESVTSILSNDERALFILGNQLLVYNVSDLSDPKLLAIHSFLTEEYYVTGTVISGSLSPDGKTLFARDDSSMRDSEITLIDVSDPSSPQICSTFRFPILDYNLLHNKKFFWVSADSKTLYIARPYSLMVLDVSDSRSPKYMGSIKILDEFSSDYVRDFSISADGKKAFVSTKLGKLITAAINPLYCTFMKQDTLMLGERYNVNLEVLKMNEYMDYDGLEVDYKIMKFALVETYSLQRTDFEQVTFKLAPSWMNFDSKTQTLSVEARRKNDIGRYKVYFGFSTRLEMNVFSKVNESMSSENLIATLVALGYLDNQRFLTGDFGEFADFILPSDYSASDKSKIYQIMKEYSFGTFNEVQVAESLVVRSDKNQLQISTSSLSNLKIEIGLFGRQQQGHFLSRHYGNLAPVITSEKSRLFMEGSLKDINLALGEVVINLPNGTLCDGEIIIDDKLNPVRNEYVKNISRLFNHNLPPGLNNKSNFTIQNQVDQESLKMGLYFYIKLNQKTFFDNYTDVENLNYQLVYMKDDKNETTVLPTWLSFSDMTLMGTAPEELFNRDFEFKLVVKNEFQELKVPFMLHVNVSSNYVLKILMKYSPYILSIVGLLISANKIFNVVLKGTYRHPKNFCLNIGEEVTSEVIFPISFVREEITEAGRILKVLEKKIGSKQELLASFRENGKLDKLKLLGAVKDCLNELTYQEKKSFKLYLEGHLEEEFHPRRLVDQILVNSLVKDLLRSNKEKETRECFERIKGRWSEFVEWDLLNSCFKINPKKVNEILQQGSTKTNDMEDGLLERININIDLLEDAILAHAFDCQNIDAQPVFTQLKVKEKIETNFLKRFLKLDLEDSSYNEKGQIGFGMGYSREYSTIYFNGIVKADMMNKTIVIQITNLKQKILKELWLFSEDREGTIEERNEIEAKGRDYEIF